MPSAKFNNRNPAPPSSVSPSSSPSVKAYQNNSDTLRSNNNREGVRKKTFKRMSNYATLTLNSSSENHQQQYQRPADTREYAGYDDILSPDIYDDDYYGDDAAANYYNNSADRRKQQQQQQPDIARKPSNGGSSSGGGGGGGYLDDIMKGINGRP